MKKIAKIFSLVIGLSIIASCDLDLLDNPNAVTTKNLDVNYLLNSIELTFTGNFDGFQSTGARLSRIYHQGGVNYDNAVGPNAFSGLWNNVYANTLVDIKALIPVAEAAGLFVHAGIAKTLRAYTLLSMVDYLGDIPLSEALNPENFNPKVEAGKTVYTAAIADLDAAVADFAKTSKGGATSDLIFGGNADSWTRAANSIKLKALLNLRLTDKAGSTSGINTLISSNKLISTTAQNFTFKYGSNLTNPDTRHPKYQYGNTGIGDYMSNSHMGELLSSKSKPDPRIRFYYYRQALATTKDVNELRCINNSKPAHYSNNDVYCFVGTVGYWGRDHLNNEGTPPDGLRKTGFGVYPSGGLFDDDAAKPVLLGVGAGGAGIAPIMMRSFVDFMLAEAALILGTTGNAKDLLKSAIEKSMADVRAMAMGTSEASRINAFESAKGIVWATEVTSYINEVLAAYDATTTNDAKLAIIAKEYWLALMGSGTEAYNLYRRTGQPAQQPGLDPNPGTFAYSLYYPANYVAQNSNAKQKTNLGTRVFWDTNTFQLK